MNERTTIQLTPESERILGNLRDLPASMVRSIAKGMDVANAVTVSHIQIARLTGQGPFAIAEHRLGVRSHMLRGALWASKATVSGDQIESSIGDPVKYAAIHEFGGVIHHKARHGTVRLRTNARGELLHQKKNPHLAVFAKSSHKLAKEVGYEADEYDVVMPERAPIRTGIQESLQEYGKEIGNAIQAAWDAM